MKRQTKHKKPPKQKDRDRAKRMKRERKKLQKEHPGATVVVDHGTVMVATTVNSPVHEETPMADLLQFRPTPQQIADSLPVISIALPTFNVIHRNNLNAQSWADTTVAIYGSDATAARVQKFLPEAALLYEDMIAPGQLIDGFTAKHLETLIRTLHRQDPLSVILIVCSSQRAVRDLFRLFIAEDVAYVEEDGALRLKSRW